MASSFRGALPSVHLHARCFVFVKLAEKMDRVGARGLIPHVRANPFTGDASSDAETYRGEQMAREAAG